MRVFLAAIFVIVFATACATTPAAPAEPLATRAGDSAVTSEPGDQSASPAVENLATAVPTSSPTLAATLEPVAATEAPAQSPGFALLQNYIPALKANLGDDWDAFDIRGLDFDPASGLIAVSGCVNVCDSVMNGYPVLLVLDKEQRDPPRRLEILPKGRISDADFIPGARRLVYATRQGIMEYDLSTDTSNVLLAEVGERYTPINDISPDGRYLASSIDNSLFITDLTSGKNAARITGVYHFTYYDNYFNLSGNRIYLLANQEGTLVRVYDVPTWQLLHEENFPEKRLVAVSPDGNFLATAARESGMISMISLTDGKESWQRADLFDRIYALAYSPDGDQVLVSGSPVESASYFENTHILDATDGKLLGSLVYGMDYYNLQFIEDGAELLTLSGASFGLWGAEPAEFRQVRGFVQEYFSAITGGDFEHAAEMTSLDEYAVQELEELGFDPADLVTAFKALCIEDEVPCLPLGEVVRVNAGDGEYWDYEILVTLQQPDGQILLFDQIEPYEYMGVRKDAGGNLKITTLHPGMRYPFQ